MSAAVKISDLTDDQLAQAYMDISNDKNAALPLDELEKNSILFGFSSADIIYVQFENKWQDATPAGMEGTMYVVKTEQGFDFIDEPNKVN